MKGRLQKLFYALIAISMLILNSDLVTSAQATKPTTTYELYPSVQKISYKATQYTLAEHVNVVFEANIDQYTKDHLLEVLAIQNITPTISDDVVEGMQNVLIGVHNSGGVVDQYFTKQSINDRDHFTNEQHFDSHMLSINNGTIAILGKDTDSAFYGITTLKHIFNQVQNKTIENLLIKDFADIQYRGFIEGYYGTPWSTEDRINLMKFGGDYKMNQYMYAPKDEPYHNSKWREPYPAAMLEDIRLLAQAGNKSKNRFVWTIHPFMNRPIRFDTEENYQEDLTAIKQKFTQMLEVGVRQFGVLADDAGAARNEDQVRMLEDLSAWLKEQQATYPDLKIELPYCPAAYDNITNTMLKELNKSPENIQIMNTGKATTYNGVWGSINDQHAKAFREFLTTANHPGRKPYYWVNWPCIDNTKQRLIMGGNDKFLEPGNSPENIQGIVINPMMHAEANKSAIFATADYGWQIWKDKAEADQNWNDSFKYMNHDTATETKASQALREVSKHMIKQGQDGRVIELEESVELAPILKTFMEDFEAKRDFTDSAADAIAALTKIKEAAEYYLANGRRDVAREIGPHIKSLRDLATANIQYINAALMLQGTPDYNGAWEYFSNGQTKLEESKYHGFRFTAPGEDFTMYARAGMQHMEPFATKLGEALEIELSPVINPNVQIKRFITNRSDAPAEGSVENILDGDDATSAVFKTPAIVSKGDYVGVTFTKPIELENVRVAMGNNKNYMNYGKFQYTVDGENWMDVSGTEYVHPVGSSANVTVQEENIKLGEKIKGIRLIATRDNTKDIWLVLYGIDVNYKTGGTNIPSKYTGTVTLHKLSVQGGSKDLITDGDRNTFAHLAEDPYKNPSNGAQDFIPADATITITFDEAKQLGSISLKQAASGDRIAKGVLEYTTDGTHWIAIGEYNNKEEMVANLTSENIHATAVRIRNLEATNGWWKVYEFEVTPPSAEDDPSAPLQYNIIKTPGWSQYTSGGQSESHLHDGNDDTSAEYYHKDNNNSRVGDYIGYDLGRQVQLGDVHIVVGGSRDAKNKWTKYKLEYSTDNSNWTTYKEYTGVASGKDYIDEDLRGITARYIRITNMVQVNVWVHFSEFDVKERDDLPTTDYMYTNTTTNVSATHHKDRDAMLPVTITLANGEYVGFKFERIKDLSKILLEIDTQEFTLQVSNNGVHWETITDVNNPGIGRYVRLINTTGNPITANIKQFEVTSHEVDPISLQSSTIGINASWGDTRNNGQGFDGNVNTTTKFGAAPIKDQYIIYDLGQTRTLNHVKLYNNDSEYDYFRDAEMYVTNDLSEWGNPIMTIGDGIENTGDSDTTALNSGLFKTSSKYPNKMFAESIEFEKTGRYLIIKITADYKHRAIVINEIVLNEDEYVRSINDPTFVTTPIEERGSAPQNLTDGNLSTSYKPNTNEGNITSGSLIYRISDMTETKRMNILQSGATISNAKVLARGYQKGETIISEKEIGVLSRTLNGIENYDFDHIFEIEIQWSGIAPTLQEIILFEDYSMTPGDKSALQSAYTEHIGKLTSGIYTTSSIASLKHAMDKADVVLNMNIATQYLLDETLSTLQKTVQALVLKADAIDDFKTLYETAITYQAKDFASSNWVTFTEALKEAGVVYNRLEDVVQSEVDHAKIQLQAAMDALVAKTLIADKLAELKKVRMDYPAIDYTKHTHDAFLTVIEKYEAILANEASITHALLQPMSKEITAKINELLDVRPLRTAIEHAEKNYGESAYEAAAWAQYGTLLNEAKAILKKADANANDLAYAIQKCEEAKAILVADAVEALKNEVARLANIANIDADGNVLYAKNSYDFLQAVINRVHAYISAGTFDDETTFGWIKKLEQAEAELVDVRPLREFIKVASQDVREEDYSKSSWSIFVAAIANAEIDLAKPELRKEDVNKHIDAIHGTKLALVNVATLRKAILDANVMDVTRYTNASAEAFKNALANAETVVDTEAVTTSEVAEALRMLQATQDALVLKADKTIIEKALMEAFSYLENKALYTKESFVAFEVAYDALKAIFEQIDPSKDDADKAIEALQESIARLVKIILVTDEKHDVSIIGSINELPENVTLEVNEIIEHTHVEEIKSLLPKNLTNSVILNITLLHEGKVIQPNGSVQVKIRIPENFDHTKLVLHHIDDTAKEVAFRIDGDYLIFTADKFSMYVISEVGEVIHPTPSPEQPPLLPTPNPGVDGLPNLQTPQVSEEIGNNSFHQGGVNTGDVTSIPNLILMMGLTSGVMLTLKKKRRNKK